MHRERAARYRTLRVLTSKHARTNPHFRMVSWRPVCSVASGHIANCAACAATLLCCSMLSDAGHSNGGALLMEIQCSRYQLARGLEEAGADQQRSNASQLSANEDEPRSAGCMLWSADRSRSASTRPASGVIAKLRRCGRLR